MDMIYGAMVTIESKLKQNSILENCYKSPAKRPCVAKGAKKHCAAGELSLPWAQCMKDGDEMVFSTDQVAGVACLVSCFR